MVKEIPFNKPYIAGNEIKYINNSIANGHISGRGPFTIKAENILKKQTYSSSDVFLTSSCTHALEISSILINLNKGDEIIVPSYTFVTTALAFYMHGAKIVFADIRVDTLNIDENKIEKLISKKTKAIVVVHYAGVGCEMDTIMKIAKKYNLIIVEDNAHGLYAKYKKKNLGTFGNLSTLSFHETKNIISGEGGAIIVNDKKLTNRTENILEKGTNKLKFLKGHINKYHWVDKGSSYVMSDLLASFLCAQLEKSEKIRNIRKKIWLHYNKNLKNWSLINRFRLPFVPKHCDQSHHMFYIILPNKKTRDKMILYLNKQNIKAIFHYLPLHLSKIAKKQSRQYDCPISKKISERIIRLPFYNNIKISELNYIISSIKKFNI